MLVLADSSSAHRPYFEEEDLTPEQPWLVSDPSVSTAFYGTLSNDDDVDYFVFDGKQGQSVLVAITIPQIEGQKDFAPSLLISGAGLDAGILPPGVDLKLTTGQGLILIPPSNETPETFFEPFSGTSYWNRQDRRVILPENGRYTVAVWHPQGDIGRYVFVIGDKERPGGDPLFPVKMKSYWTPVSEETADQQVRHLGGLWNWIVRMLGIRD